MQYKNRLSAWTTPKAFDRLIESLATQSDDNITTTMVDVTGAVLQKGCCKPFLSTIETMLRLCCEKSDVQNYAKLEALVRQKLGSMAVDELVAKYPAPVLEEASPISPAECPSDPVPIHIEGDK